MARLERGLDRGSRDFINYPEATWNGRSFVETGRIVTVCGFRCYAGL